MAKRNFVEAISASINRMSDVFKGVQYIEPEEYFKRNSALVEPKGYLQFPQYIKDWLYRTYGDKGDCIVMKSYSHPFYKKDPLDLVKDSLNETMGDNHIAGNFEVKPRHEVEHDPNYIQLIASCFIITPVGNVIGVRNLRHPQIGGVLSIPQGHVEPVENLTNKTLREVLHENISRVLDEELEFILNGETHSFNEYEKKYTMIKYYPIHSPEHLFITFILDLRKTDINKPLTIIGKEEFNMIEIYAMDEIPEKTEEAGDFLFNQYFVFKFNNMVEGYKRKSGIGIDL